MRSPLPLLAAPLLALAMPCLAQEGRRKLEELRRTSKAACELAEKEGAVFKETPDGLSYYVYWEPDNGGKKNRRRRVLVTLHGESGSALDELLSWRLPAAERGLGVLAIQWRLAPGGDVVDFYSPPEIFRNLDDELKSLKVRPGDAMLHGYGRGAVTAYGVAALDRTEGRKAFSLVVADSGGLDGSTATNGLLTLGVFGPRPFDGLHWALCCGLRAGGRGGCPAMRRAREEVERLGGAVDLAIEAPDAGERGLYGDPGAMGRVLDLFASRQPPAPAAAPRKAAASPKPEKDAKAAGAVKARKAPPRAHRRRRGRRPRRNP